MTAFKTDHTFENGSYSEFRAARAAFDPKGVFSNTFLDELFG